ncbi:MAG TPA: rRNA maturation RNase YbeY [Verrucomicrobiae bacterium]|nr:rRNA maturation RNase YbeY [Verrucomicrobiae bacterium]
MELVINSRQRDRRLDRKLLKQIAEFTLAESLVEAAELGIHFVSAKEMAKVHEQFMNIDGSTDVITFDHGSQPPAKIHGEIFISIEDAVAQARDFQTSWQSETARYIVHGILHLLSYDDLEPKARAKMKREENRLVSKLESNFNLRQIEKR